MKRLSLLLALSFVLLSFGLANAIEFDVQLSASSFYNPVLDGNFYPENTDITASVMMRNNTLTGSTAHPDSLADWCGWGMGFRMYATRGGVEVEDVTITQVDIGGGFITPSILRVNGFGSGDDPHYWPQLNSMYTTSFDGHLPDTLAHHVAGGGSEPPDYPGCWLPYGIHLQISPLAWVSDYPSITHVGEPGYDGDQSLLPRIQIGLKVSLSGEADTISICFDKVELDGTNFDWLFPDDYETVDFGGPYCFPFSEVPDLPPHTDLAGLTELTTQHHVDFNLSPALAITDTEGGTITNVGAIDETDAAIGTPTLGGGSGGVGTLSWTYNPPCSWVGETGHTVRFYAEEAGMGHVYPNVDITAPVTLTVLNSDPVINETTSDCGETFIIGVTQTKQMKFYATDPNSGDLKQWSVTMTPAPYATDDTTSTFDGNGDLIFTYTPDAETAEDDYVVCVTVTDCADATDDCCATFQVTNQLPFDIYIEVEDGNNGGKAPYVLDGDGVYLGQHAYVDVVQGQGTEENRGFDFMIAYDNSALAFMGASGNPDLFLDVGTTDIYEWEYFTYRFVDNCGGSCPSGLLEVIAIADQNDGAHTPTGYVLPDDFVLFTMDFMVSSDYTLECQFVPISFYWTDCQDNSIAMRFLSEPPLQIKQAIAKEVYGFADGYYPMPDPTSFPTYYGPLPECYCVPDGTMDPEDPDKCPVPWINFYNGGIKIICSDDIDDRGDINLNGVRWEIADAVVLTNYFIYGMPAFTINPEGQKAASDVNADGIVLSVADLVYLIRIIVGDILPIDKMSPYAAEAIFGHVGDVVTTDADLGAALFVFEGNVEVALAEGAAHMEIKSDYVDGYTRTLIYSFDKGATFTGNVLNTSGEMVSVEAVDYYGAAYSITNLPTSFAVKNYPNPFNPTATIEMALPVATDWSITIYNVAGQKVAGFNGYSEAGVERVVWDASQQASGIYFYKVQTDKESLTKKMVLLK